MAERVRAGVKFFGAAFGQRHVHRQLVAVVAFPDAEGEAALFQIVDALDSPRPVMGTSQRGQQHRREDGEDGHDDEQGD